MLIQPEFRSWISWKIRNIFSENTGWGVKGHSEFLWKFINFWGQQLLFLSVTFKWSWLVPMMTMNNMYAAHMIWGELRWTKAGSAFLARAIHCFGKKCTRLHFLPQLYNVESTLLWQEMHSAIRLLLSIAPLGNCSAWLGGNWVSTIEQSSFLATAISNRRYVLATLAFSVVLGVF